MFVDVWSTRVDMSNTTTRSKSCTVRGEGIKSHSTFLLLLKCNFRTRVLSKREKKQEGKKEKMNGTKRH